MVVIIIVRLLMVKVKLNKLLENPSSSQIGIINKLEQLNIIPPMPENIIKNIEIKIII